LPILNNKITIKQAEFVNVLISIVLKHHTQIGPVDNPFETQKYEEVYIETRNSSHVKHSNQNSSGKQVYMRPMSSENQDMDQIGHLIKVEADE